MLKVSVCFIWTSAAATSFVFFFNTSSLFFVFGQGCSFFKTWIFGFGLFLDTSAEGCWLWSCILGFNLGFDHLQVRIRLFEFFLQTKKRLPKTEKLKNVFKKFRTIQLYNLTTRYHNYLPELC